MISTVLQRICTSPWGQLQLLDCTKIWQRFKQEGHRLNRSQSDLHTAAIHLIPVVRIQI